MPVGGLATSWRIQHLQPPTTRPSQPQATPHGSAKRDNTMRLCLPNLVARAHADPLRDRSVLLQLLSERLLGLQAFVGRLHKEERAE